MKRILQALAFFLTINLFWTVPAMAHYTYMEPAGQQAVADGEQICVDVYAHAETADELSFFSVSVGFDDAALGGELTFDSFALNPAFMPMPAMFPGSYQQGQSEAKPGQSKIKDIGGMVGFGQYLPVAANEDVFLFSITYTATGPEDAFTGDDIWLEWDSISSGAVFWKESGKSDTFGANGLDVATVPVPGALLLLGSGLVGLVGIRRRGANR